MTTPVKSRKNLFTTLFASVIAFAIITSAGALVFSQNAEAKGRGGGGMSFRSSAPRVAPKPPVARAVPKPTPKPAQQHTTETRTIIVQQPAAVSSGGGMLSSFVGGAAGAAVGSYLMRPDAPQEEAGEELVPEQAQ